jgi:CheY-like chemotaxis protein
MSILVVEHNPFLGRLFCLELEGAGHPTILVETWEGALRLAAVQRPGVVLVDATLAPKEGARCIRDLLALPGLSDVPVVGIALARWAEHDLLDAGADCCIRVLPAKGDILKAVTWALTV